MSRTRMTSLLLRRQILVRCSVSYRNVLMHAGLAGVVVDLIDMQHVCVCQIN